MSAIRVAMVAVLAWLLAPGAARAGLCADDDPALLRFETRSGLSEYLAALGADLAKDAVVTATARIGDTRLDGAWELGLTLPGNAAEATAQARWSKTDEGGWQDFSLRRDGDRLTLMLGEAITALVDPRLRDIDTLVLFASADARKDEARLHKLALNGAKLDEPGLSAGGGTDQALLRGLDGDFVLSGQARLRWDARVDGRDPARMMLQVAGYALSGPDMLTGDVLTTTAGAMADNAAGMAPIPEPATATLLAAGVLGLAMLRRKIPRAGSGGRI